MTFSFKESKQMSLTQTLNNSDAKFDGNKEKNQFFCDLNLIGRNLIYINGIIKIERIIENGGKISMQFPSKSRTFLHQIQRYV